MSFLKLLFAISDSYCNMKLFWLGFFHTTEFRPSEHFATGKISSFLRKFQKVFSDFQLNINYL